MQVSFLEKGDEITAIDVGFSVLTAGLAKFRGMQHDDQFELDQECRSCPFQSYRTRGQCHEPL